MAKLLVIDNYDSFTYNLVQMFMRYDLEILVHRSDRISLHEVCRMKPDYALISPGPRDPAHAGISTALIESFYDKIPILAVCLGMQCMNEAFGGKTIRSPQPMHGKTTMIYHDGKGIFQSCPSPFSGARYHSLIVEHHCSDLVVTATTRDKLIMGLSHVQYPLHGVQFHPESFLTENGSLIIENFLELGPFDGSQ